MKALRILNCRNNNIATLNIRRKYIPLLYVDKTTKLIK